MLTSLFPGTGFLGNLYPVYYQTCEVIDTVEKLEVQGNFQRQQSNEAGKTRDNGKSKDATTS